MFAVSRRRGGSGPTMRATPHRMRAHAGVCPRVRTLALSMLASRASSTSVPTEASVDAAVRGACARGLLATAKSVDDHPLGFFYDLDAFEANMASLRHAFPPHWHHATAVKTNPLSALLRLTRDAGHGAECASIGEVQHVLRQGFAPDAVVYDSPCKTEAEIRFALERGDPPPPQRRSAPSPSPSPGLGSSPYPHPHSHYPSHLRPHAYPNQASTSTPTTCRSSSACAPACKTCRPAAAAAAAAAAAVAAHR